jgi:hypothetical protein
MYLGVNYFFSFEEISGAHSIGAKDEPLVSIPSTIYPPVFCTKVLFLLKHNQKKAAQSNFVQKRRA